jgi:hypothetical protein
MKLTVLFAAGMLAAVPAFAQTATTAPGQTGAPVVQGGSPAIANSGPASTGTVAPSGTGAESMSNNSAQSGNAGQPSRAIPQTGGGSAGTAGASGGAGSGN